MAEEFEVIALRILEHKRQKGLLQGVPAEVLEEMARDLSGRLEDVTNRLILEEVERLGALYGFERALDSENAEDVENFLRQTIPRWDDFSRKVCQQAVDSIS